MADPIDAALSDDGPRGVRLLVHAQPGARKAQVHGMHGGRLKIAVVAPPVDGKANAALIAIMAEWLGRPKRSVQIVAGDKSRDKTLYVEGVTLEFVKKTLSALLPDQ
jgi:uncharacterized protein (TIGR00251 family)